MKPGHFVTIIISFLALVCLFIFLSLAASAHSWYEAACCSGKDCEPIPFEAVTETKDGYQVDYWSQQGFQVHGFVPRDKARHSQDGRFHGCAMPSRFLCLYVPVNS